MHLAKVVARVAPFLVQVCEEQHEFLPRVERGRGLRVLEFLVGDDERRLVGQALVYACHAVKNLRDREVGVMARSQLLSRNLDQTSSILPHNACLGLPAVAAQYRHVRLEGEDLGQTCAKCVPRLEDVIRVQVEDVGDVIALCPLLDYQDQVDPIQPLSPCLQPPVLSPIDGLRALRKELG